MTEPNSSHTWRLIVGEDLTGSVNMALDEALLQCFRAGGALPVLRFYGWSPPTLSVGRFQDVATTVDIDCCLRRGVSLVRRMTGGGAIYHADEITYSIVCTQEQISASTSVKESFRVLTGFLLGFYRELGLDAHYAVDVCNAGQLLGERTPFCFAGRESFDILINGRKIGGNAQRRNRDIIFQHGSIPVINRSRAGLHYMCDHAESQAEHTTSLAELGITASREVLVERLAESFRRHMGVMLIASNLTSAEDAAKRKLLDDIYTSDHWNLKGERG